MTGTMAATSGKPIRTSVIPRATTLRRGLPAPGRPDGVDRAELELEREPDLR